MRSNRVATLAVIAGLALLGSAAAGVGGITARTVARPDAPIAHHHDHDGDHDGDHGGPHGGHGV
jgi:hypothetical protein